MPIYEYICEGCGHHAEVIQPVPTENEQCPHCDGKLVRVQFPRTGDPQFRGSGFYRTDYKDKP